MAAPKKNRACLPCHERKIRCQAPSIGTPCHSCIQRGCQERCVRALRRPRVRVRERLQSSTTSASDATGSNDLEPHSRPVDNSPQRPEDRDGVQATGSLPQAPSQVHYAGSSDYSSLPGLEGSPASFGAAGNSDDRVFVRMCNEVATSNGIPPVQTLLRSVTPYRDSITYRDGSHLLSILAKVVGANARKLTRVLLQDEVQCQAAHVPERPDRETRVGPATLEMKFLKDKGALSMPPSPYREKLLQVYFRQCHPYAPVFDRVQFMHSLASEGHSWFLVQAVLASSAQYAPLELLSQCGFENREAAQRQFSENAASLYDLGHERSQLRLLQGSIVLGSSISSYTQDKDFRYWLANAVRIAAKMGLHKSHIADDMDPAAYSLCRRLFGCLYDADVLLSLVGFKNMRLLDRTACTMGPVTQDDWDSTDIPEQFCSVLDPITLRQKLYMVERNKLCAIGELCLPIRDGRFADLDGYPDDLARKFTDWRSSLPDSLRLNSNPCSVQENLEAIVLLATSFRFECILYHTLRRHYSTLDNAKHSRANQQLKTAMLEVDNLIGRAMTDGLLRMLPLSFVNCVLTVITLRLESIADPNEPPMLKSMAIAYAQHELLLLRSLRDLPLVERCLILLELIIEHKRLPIPNVPSTTSASATHTSYGQFQEESLVAPSGFSLSGYMDPFVPWFEDILSDEFFGNVDFSEM